MGSDDDIWLGLIDPRFSLLELMSTRGHQIRYLDMVTGWGGDIGFRLRQAAAAIDRSIAPERAR
jgi:hypothetical protein